MWPNVKLGTCGDEIHQLYAREVESLIKDKVLVIGGGIAGMSSAVELARSGFYVYLVDKAETLGGKALDYCCKATENCSRCGVCLVPKKAIETRTQPRVTVYNSASVARIIGEVGNFTVYLTRHLPPIDPHKCIACGECARGCPSQAIETSVTAGSKPTYTLARNRCQLYHGEPCSLCVDSCPVGALSFSRQPETMVLNVGAIIAATGFSHYDLRQGGGWGYQRFTNVLSGKDAESLIRRTGTLRLANGGIPQKVAFIQCVGSRNAQSNRGYCSQVCCKYALRIARLLKSQNQEVEITIFHMDIQSAGKAFWELYQECRESMAFVHGLPMEIFRGDNGKLLVRYEDIAKGQLAHTAFDLIILSTGILPGEGNVELARMLGISLDRYGFFAGRSQDACVTNRRGVFIAGACQGPKDIAGSLAQGLEAAGKVKAALCS